MTGPDDPDLPDDEDTWIPLDVVVNAFVDALAEDVQPNPQPEAAE